VSILTNLSVMFPFGHTNSKIGTTAPSVTLAEATSFLHSELPSCEN